MTNIKVEKNGTVIGKAVDLDRLYSSPIFILIFFLIWLAGLASIVVLANNILINYFELPSSSTGIALIALSIFLFYQADRCFVLNKVKHPHIYSLLEFKNKIARKEGANIFEIFSFELAKATSSLFSEKSKPTLGELSLRLIGSKDMDFTFVRLGISKNNLMEEAKKIQAKPIDENILTKALEIAILEGHHQIEVGDMFAALTATEAFFKKILSDLKLELVDLLNVVYWQTGLIRKVKQDKRFLDPSKFRLTGGIGRDWAFGWTPFLKQFSVDITKEIEARGLDLEIIGHNKEIDEIKEALLRQNGGNAVIVGDAGVGKKTTILGFAKQVLEGRTYSPLDFQHIVKIETDYLIAGLTHPGEVTQRISGLLSEVTTAGNIIIYIENIQNLLSSGDAGKVDASEVLLPFLEHPNMHVLATCDVASFNQYVLPNNALSQRFTRVSVEEPTKKEMIRILEDSVSAVEYRTRTIISYEALKEVINSADKYIVNLPNPEKSINLLDGVAGHASSQRGKTIVLPKDVLDFVSLKYEIPVGEANEQEKKKLLDLENIMHQSVIGQDEAIDAISNAMRRARAGVTDSKKPIGSFLFLGPTGVGKTESAKALALAYFGKEDRMIRFDMSEYQSKEDIYRFIGANLGNEKVQGTLTTAVREHPFSLLLFDEVEKAHRDILDLFLQILDEGFLTDGFGRKVAFSNTIIIATSNAGANIIRESIKSGIQYEKVKKGLLDYLQRQNIYRPEFLNRFSGIVAFSPLSELEIEKVGGLLIQKLAITMEKNKGINLKVAPESVRLLAHMGYDPQMGARPMARMIEEKLENLLANKILSGDLQKGDSITIEPKDIQASS